MRLYHVHNNHGNQLAFVFGFIGFGYVYDIQIDRCRWFLKFGKKVLKSE